MDKLTPRIEKEITKMIAEQNYFYLTYRNNKVFRANCQLCGKRLMAHAKGHINERMIEHKNTFHLRFK